MAECRRTGGARIAIDTARTIILFFMSGNTSMADTRLLEGNLGRENATEIAVTTRIHRIGATIRAFFTPAAGRQHSSDV
jgi:hypothetical protein